MRWAGRRVSARATIGRQNPAPRSSVRASVRVHPMTFSSSQRRRRHVGVSLATPISARPASTCRHRHRSDHRHGARAARAEYLRHRGPASLSDPNTATAERRNRSCWRLETPAMSRASPIVPQGLAHAFSRARTSSAAGAMWARDQTPVAPEAVTFRWIAGSRRIRGLGCSRRSHLRSRSSGRRTRSL
jgi:hypothetical protein